jgi:predicted DNA binding CopG/RHH family protein
MKSISIRMSEELLERLREMAARETIKRKKYVSINTLAVEILTKATKKGG